MSSRVPDEAPARVVPLRARPGPAAPQTAVSQGPEPLWRHLVGGVLRSERAAQGRTLRDVADAARISMPYLSELERGRKEASSEVLAAAARALGLGLPDLLLRVQADLARAVRPRTTPGPGRRNAHQPDTPAPVPPGPQPGTDPGTGSDTGTGADPSADARAADGNDGAAETASGSASAPAPDAVPASGTDPDPGSAPDSKAAPAPDAAREPAKVTSAVLRRGRPGAEGTSARAAALRRGDVRLAA